MYVAPMQGNLVLLGAVLRAVREARKETIEDAAALFGCSRSHLNNIELGRKKPGTDLLFRMGSHYDISLDDFIASPEGKLVRARGKLTPLQGIIVEITDTMTQEQVKALVAHLLASYKPKRN